MTYISIPAIEITQSGTNSYLVSLKYKTAAAIASSVGADQSKPEDQRYQRVLIPKKVRSICDYLVTRENCILPPVILSAFGKSIFFEKGQLHFGQDTEWAINDGQHRLSGIKEALFRADLQGTIGSQIYINPTIQQMQQWFVDINRTASKPTFGQTCVFEHIDENIKLSRMIATTVFSGRIEMLKPNARGNKLMSLATLTKANSTLPNGTDPISFWRNVDSVLWRGVNYAQRRETHIDVTALGIEAIAMCGEAHDSLARFDWTRQNCDFTFNGRLVKNKTNVIQLAAKLKDFFRW